MSAGAPDRKESSGSGYLLLPVLVRNLHFGTDTVGWIRTPLWRLNGIDRWDQRGYFRLLVFHVSHLLSFVAFDFQLLAS